MPTHGLSPLQALKDYDQNQQAHLYAEGLLHKVLNKSQRDPPMTQEPPEGDTPAVPNPTNNTGGAAQGRRTPSAVPNPTSDTGTAQGGGGGSCSGGGRFHSSQTTRMDREVSTY